MQLEKLQVEFKESLRESYEPLQAQIDGLVARVEQVRYSTGWEGGGVCRRSRRGWMPWRSRCPTIPEGRDGRIGEGCTGVTGSSGATAARERKGAGKAPGRATVGRGGSVRLRGLV